jgi:hypothetical protein
MIISRRRRTAFLNPPGAKPQVGSPRSHPILAGCDEIGSLSSTTL